VSTTSWLLIGAGAALLAYAGFVAWLFAAGRRTDARALAGFVPDCVVLFRRLLADPRVPPARKAAVAGLLAYLLLPIDLVPDVIPVAGQLDDLILAAVVLRLVLRAGGPELLREHWPGPDSSRTALLRVAGYPHGV
jgi:uncharacterized membrane protein YkvA (DUF1232 family)